MNTEGVISLAVKKYKKEQAKNNTDYTAEDALIYALEEYDTGYDLTEKEYMALILEVKRS